MDDPIIMFCYIPVKVRKLLDMGLLIKMILSASDRFFQSENPMVKDLEVRIEVDQEERGIENRQWGLLRVKLLKCYFHKSKLIYFIYI